MIKNVKKNGRVQHLPDMSVDIAGAEKIRWKDQNLELISAVDIVLHYFLLFNISPFQVFLLYYIFRNLYIR